METNSRIVRQWVPSPGQISEIEQRVAREIIAMVDTEDECVDTCCHALMDHLRNAIRERYGVEE